VNNAGHLFTFSNKLSSAAACTHNNNLNNNRLYNAFRDVLQTGPLLGDGTLAGAKGPAPQKAPRYGVVGVMDRSINLTDFHCIWG